jgi:hypothetical protein
MDRRGEPITRGAFVWMLEMSTSGADPADAHNGLDVMPD